MKQIPNAVNQRINRLYSRKRKFQEIKRIYDEALKNNGFQSRLDHVDPVNSGSKGRNITIGRSSGSGTHRVVKVGDTNNHSNRRGEIEIGK